jgi:hypothetical protein
VRSANLGLRVLLELAAIAAVAWWGWGAQGWWLGLLAAAALIVVWGTFIAPKRRVQVPPAVWWALQVVVFGAAALALGAAWSVVAGVVFALVVAVHLGLAAAGFR